VDASNAEATLYGVCLGATVALGRAGSVQKLWTLKAQICAHGVLINIAARRSIQASPMLLSSSPVVIPNGMGMPLGACLDVQGPASESMARSLLDYSKWTPGWTGRPHDRWSQAEPPPGPFHGMTDSMPGPYRLTSLMTDHRPYFLVSFSPVFLVSTMVFYRSIFHPMVDPISWSIVSFSSFGRRHANGNGQPLSTNNEHALHSTLAPEVPAMVPPKMDSSHGIMETRASPYFIGYPARRWLSDAFPFPRRFVLRGLVNSGWCRSRARVCLTIIIGFARVTGALTMPLVATLALTTRCLIMIAKTPQ
jgi:hypothetical protein